MVLPLSMLQSAENDKNVYLKQVELYIQLYVCFLYIC